LADQEKQDLYKEKYSKVGVYDEVATILGLVASSGIVYLKNMELMFAIAAILMLVTAIFTYLRLLEPNNYQQEQGDLLDKLKSKPKKSLQKGWQLIKQHHYIFWIFLIFALLSESGRVLWQPQLKNLGLPIEYLGLIFAGFNLFSALGSYVSGKIDRKINLYHFSACL
jgi:hypothetical protein